MTRAYHENRKLAADTKALNQSLVAFRATIFQILEHFPPAGDHGEESATGMMILVMGLEMLSQLKDTLTQKRDLNLWRSGVRLMDLVLADNLRLLLYRQGHARKRYSSSLPNLYFSRTRVTQTLWILACSGFARGPDTLGIIIRE